MRIAVAEVGLNRRVLAVPAIKEEMWLGMRAARSTSRLTNRSMSWSARTCSSNHCKTSMCTITTIEAILPRATIIEATRLPLQLLQRLRVSCHTIAVVTGVKMSESTTTATAEVVAEIPGITITTTSTIRTNRRQTIDHSTIDRRMWSSAMRMAKVSKVGVYS